MRSKRIVYIGGFELPDKNAAAQRVIGNGKLFNINGYDVTYIGISKNSKNDINKVINNEGFSCYSIKYPKNKIEWLKYIVSAKKVKKILNDIKEIDIVVLYNYQSLPMWSLMKYCKKRNIKVVSDCTEWYQPSGGLLFKLIKGIDTTLRMKYLHKKLDGIITISEYLTNYYKEQTTIELPPLVDLKDEKWRKVEKNRDGIISFNYAGSPGKNKDKINEIIEVLALEKFNQYKFIFNVVGITKDEYLLYYPEHRGIIELLEGKVFLKGRVSHREALNIVKKSDYTIFIREDNRVTKAGFPTKFAESYSCNTPVITTMSSNLNKYVKNGENGFVVELDDIKGSLDKILSNCIINNIRVRISNEDNRIFDFNNYYEECENFLSSILK